MATYLDIGYGKMDVMRGLGDIGESASLVVARHRLAQTQIGTIARRWFAGPTAVAAHCVVSSLPDGLQPNVLVSYCPLGAHVAASIPITALPVPSSSRRLRPAYWRVIRWQSAGSTDAPFVMSP